MKAIFYKHNLLQGALYTFIFTCFIFVTTLYAGTATVDLSVTLDAPSTTIEASQPFSNIITITNNNSSGSNLDATGSQVVYNITSGSTYNSFSGTNWSCTHDSSTATCTYNGSLTNGQTSNQLDLQINAPSSVGNITPDVEVSLSDNTDPQTSNNTDSKTFEVGKSNLHATKTASKTTLQLNEEFTYTIELSNPNNGSNPTVKARNVTISDTLPSQISFVSLNDTSWCSQSNGTITCSGSDLDVSNTRSVTITAKATSGGTNIKNTATTNTDSTDYNTMPEYPNATVDVQLANIVLSQSLVGGITSTNAAVDSNVTYRLHVVNNGASPASNVTLTDTLPSGIISTSYDKTYWTCSGTSTINCTLNNTSLANGESYDLDIYVTMPSSHQDITNDANISTDSTESDTGDNSSSLLTHVKGADLDIVKTPDNGSTDIGTNYTYTIKVTNGSGLADAQNVSVTDTLDSNMIYASDTGGCTQSGQTLTCNLGNITSGSNASFTVTVIMPTDSLNDVTNSASVSTDTDQENSDNLTDTATTHITGPNLNITKDANVSEVGLGKTFSYTINVANVNSANATNADIEDQLPSGVKITNITPNGWTCPSTPITGTFHCTKSNFPGNSSDTLIFKATAPTNSTGQITNTAKVSHSLSSNDGTDSAIVNVTGVNLDINKLASPTAMAGGLIDYNITVTNTSHSDAEDLTITDDLSNLGSGYTVNSVLNSDGWNCSGAGTSSLTCTKASLLAEGDTSTIHFNVNVPTNATLGTRTNNASVSTTTTPQPTVTDSADTIIEGADIVVIPPTTTTAVANKNAVFTVKVRNDGSATAKDVNITNHFNTNNTANFTNILIDCNGGTNYTTGSPYKCQLGDIAKNETKTITISATAPNYDSNFPGNSKVANGSVAETSTSQSNVTNDNTDWDIEIHGSDIVVYKTADKSEVAVNGLVNYTINVKNQWEADATNIQIDDNTLGNSGDKFTFINNSLTYDGNDWNCNQNNSTHFSCTYKHDLTQNQTTSNITIQAKAPNTLSAIDNKRDNEAVITTDTAEKETATTNTVVRSVYIRGADLNISKTVSPNPAKLGEQVTYTITVANSDLAEAKNTYVDDTLPNGFTNISTSGCDNNGNSVSGQAVHCTLGDLAKGDTKTFTITANAPNTNATYTNTATTSSDTLEADTTNNSGSVDLDVRGADLNLDKWDSADPVATNSTYYYNIRVRNEGFSSAFGAEINDTIPTSGYRWSYIGPLEVQNSDWECSKSGNLIHCNTKDSNFEMAPGYNSGTIVRYKVQAPSTTGFVHNTAVVDSNTSEAQPDDNTETENTQVINIDLQAKKTINNTYYVANENYVAINGNLTYKIYVRNRPISGTNPPGITDVNITDIIPNNVTNISLTAESRFDCSTSPIHPPSFSIKLFCTMKDGENTPLEVADGWVLVATVDSTAPDATNFDTDDDTNNCVINKYKAETSFGDQDLANNAPTGGDGYLHTNTLVRGANMSIDKSVSKDPIGANRQFFYTLSIKNWPRNNTTNEHDRPSTNATNIVVKDKLPNDVNFTSASGTNWSCNENSHIVTCNYSGTISPANTPSNITINATAPNTNNEVLTNEANVTNDTPELARLLPDNKDNVDTTTQGTDISIAKTGPATAGMSDHIIYHITVTNSSAQADAKDVYVIDTLPNGATYDGNISNPNWTTTSTVGANGSIRFDYDQNLTLSTSTDFTFSSTLPHYTGTARNHVEATTSTIETSSPNVANWDTDIQGANIIFKSIPTQSPNPVGAYGHHEYYITIHNQGLSPAKDINVTLNFNNMGANHGWSDVNGTGSGWSCDTYDTVNSKLICHLPTLSNSSDSSQLTISSIAPNYNGDITNNATVIGKDDTNATTGQTVNVTTSLRGSDLKIKKYAKDPDASSDGNYHDDNITVGVGKPVDFKFTIKNDDLGVAKDINFQDSFPLGFSDFNITNQGDWNCSLSGKTITCNRLQLAPNTSAPDIFISAKSPSSAGTVTNTADENTSTIEVDNSNDSDSVALKIEGATLNTDLNVSKTLVSLGEIYTYTLDITNTGKNDGLDINSTDILNSDLTYIDNNGSDSDWNCTETGSTVACTQPLIPGYNGNSKLKLNIQAPLDSIGTYSNEIVINSNSIENPITAYAPDVRVVGADLNVSIDATPIDVLEGRNVTYNISLKDINISTAKNVVLKQTFSQAINALYITSGASDCNLTDANQSVTCHYTSIDFNQDKNITIVATMPDTNTTIDPLTSSVDVTTSTPQENQVSHSASVNVKVYPIKPVVDYRFEECKWDGTSREVVDSISGLNGTAKNGAVTLNHLLTYDDNNFSTAWRSGSFDGVDDYVEVPSDSKLQITKNQTICAWVRPTSFNSRKNIIAKAYGGEGTITQETSGDLSYYYGTAGKNGSPYQGFGTWKALTKNYWNHICLVRDLDNMKLKWYVNNVKTHEGNANYPNAVASSNPLLIGAGYVNNFKGNIDEVEIYNIALDDRAVHDIYNFEKADKNYDGTDRPETICGVDLKVVKTANPSGNVGAESNLNYTITITNLSSEPVTKGFTLSDILPADVNYTSVNSSSNLSCDNSNDNNFTCTYPSTLILKKNHSETITVDAKTANVDKVNIQNRATATPVQPDTDTSNNTGTANNKIIGTDLKITKTANPVKPNPGSAFVYTVRVENISNLANARNITIMDHYDSRLSYNSVSTNTNETNSSATCSTLGNNTISCSMNRLSMGNYVELYITMVSAGEASGLINEANVTSETVDTDLSNNSVSLSIDTNTSASGIDILRPSLKYFNNDVSANKYGNIAVIGNTMLVPNNYTGTQKLNEINSTFANSAGYTNSSSATLHVLDVNTSNPDDNITIEYAGLFWGGHLHGNDKNETGNNIPFNTVKFITPDGTVHSITVNKTDLNGSINLKNRADFYHFKKGDENNNTANMGNYRIFYGAKADITDIIKDLNTSLNGIYTVADMQVTPGDDNPDWAPTIKTENNITTTSWTRFRDYGYFGGWSMVVAYSINHRYHREIKFKNLSEFSGFVDLVPPGPGGTTQLPIPISGFITPIHGNIDSSLYDFTQGGDRQLSLEGMTVKNKNNSENAIIEDTNNTNNIFNDTITLKDVSGNNISKNPDISYNVGNDIDQYNLDSKYDSSDNCANTNGRPCYLSNSQDSTQVTISVKESDTLDGTEYPSEQSFVHMLSMQTQIFTPDFIDSYKECFKLKSTISPQLGWVPCSDPLPLLRRGDVVKYRLTVINTGDDFAQDVYILDNLPKEVNYDENSSIVTHLLPFDELETNSPCSDPNYNNNESIRTQCFDHLKALVENNATSPLTTVDANGTGYSNIIDGNYSDMTYSDVNNSLVYKFDIFPKNNLVWIEFNTTINGYASLGHTFKNKMSITFTNPTLADYNLSGGTVTQVSLPIESSPVTFNWDNIEIVARDIGRNSVGAKVVNAPFDLNLTLAGISSLDQGDANTSIYLNSLRIIDVYNGTNSDIYPTVVDSNTGIPLNTGVFTWLTHNTTYPKASKELGFDMNISIKSSDGNYSDSKIYPHDFNASAPYAGDHFSTRPKEFNMALSGPNTSTSGAYTIIKSAKSFSVNISAPDINGTNSSQDYNASLVKGNGISVGLDSTFSTNNACINQGDLNISNLNFTNGAASTNTLNYKNVGVVKLVLKDSNWTAIDQPNDCNTTSIGDNNSSDADGLISCSTDGNSTSIIFEPDHFTYTNTTVTDFNGGNFTYMVLNPINDSMFAKVSTTLEARNSDDNITSFFSNTCFGYNTNMQLSYNAQSKNLNDLNISIANENNLTNIASNSAVNTVGNTMSTLAYKNQFANGTAPITIRMAIERNATTPLQPALIDAQNLKGSMTGYLGIANADVAAGTGTDINSTGDLHYLFGRVHAPDYRFAGNSGTVKVYYEAYCKDCNQTYRNSMNLPGGESLDSVNWYINTYHGNLNDGNVSNYTPVKGTTLSTYSSTGVVGGIETIIATAPSLPYIDKIDVNATDWVTFDPKDFILEFQDDQKDWAGQGKLGHIIDTNVSKRSNRRLNW